MTSLPVEREDDDEMGSMGDRPLRRCRYCPELTRWVTCGWRSCERKREAAEDAAVERAVQRDLARYQP